MHRHGYRGRKFGRERDQRNALTTGLVLSLIEHRSITTTTAKAKEIRPIAEKIITLAKKGGLANRRLVIARLGNIKVANLLVDEIVPAIKRDSGYLRIAKSDQNRTGDNAELATIEFVDREDIEKVLEKGAAKPEPKTVVADVAKADKPVAKPVKKETK